jgi:hypothetical protein
MVSGSKVLDHFIIFFSTAGVFNLLSSEILAVPLPLAL